MHESRQKKCLMAGVRAEGACPGRRTSDASACAGSRHASSEIVKVWSFRAAVSARSSQPRRAAVFSTPITVDDDSGRTGPDSELVGAGELAERLGDFARHARWQLAQGWKDHRPAQRAAELRLSACAVRSPQAAGRARRRGATLRIRRSGLGVAGRAQSHDSGQAAHRGAAGWRCLAVVSAAEGAFDYA